MEFIATSDAPKAIGPYSQAVRHGAMLYTAGQIALDPATMEIVTGGIVPETEQVMQNLAAVLREAGLGFEHVIKTTVFLADMQEFTAMNEVYARHFGDHRPARSTVSVLGLPKGVRVEIDLVAAG
ncbi:MAG: RidA family protein [Gemmatimonadales bacterium]|nr:RidA family protein [Gemmatimonadales bacterium]